MSNYFTPTTATERNVTTRLNTAYTAAGITAPATFVPALKAHLRTVPDASQVAATIAHDAYHAPADTDVQEFWDNAVDQLILAQGADALRTALVQALATEERASGARQITRALTDLHPWAQRQADALTKAVKALPAGDAALDPEAVLAHDAGKALTAARNALAALALYASIPDAGRHVSTAGQAHRVLPVVDPGKPRTEAVNAFGTTIKGQQLDNTHAVRKLDADVRTSPDLVLIRVARGEYPGVTLAPAESVAALADRAHRVKTAFTRRTATEHEQNQMVAMR